MMRTTVVRSVVAGMLVMGLAAGAAHAQEARVDELERKVDALTQEIERMRLGAAAGGADSASTKLDSRLGFAPAAAKVYGVARGVSIGGYGEMLYENFDREREDEAPSGRLDQLDYLRAVFYFGYKFNDVLLFNSEIEIEHAGVLDEAEVEGEADSTGAIEGGVELSGEVVLEFAYLDWRPTREIGVRGGMLLVPMGFTNELHEPPIFLGARRPELDRSIIPTTWRANGIGIFGELGGALSYRAYVVEGLDARGFSASGGIRDGRQNGSRSLITQPAFTARLDWSGVAGLLVGVSGFTGDSWQDFQPAGADLDPRVSIFDVHARWSWQGLDARGVYARGALDDAGELSDELGLSGSSRLGESFQGMYVEAGYDILPRLVAGTTWGLMPYGRFEVVDTQEDVPGGSEAPANEVQIITAGAAFSPHPNVVLKADRQWRNNPADTGVSQWSVALGYLF